MPDNEVQRSRALLIAADTFEDERLQSLRSPSHDVGDLAHALADPAIGGFEVRSLINGPSHEWQREIEDFFVDSRLNELLVLYISSHGIKDPFGQLHFAATTTRLDRIASTGVSAEFVSMLINQCRARRILLLLDCCFSGAFGRGYRARPEGRAEIELRDRRGRAVITSSTALEYAFELSPGNVNVTGSSAPSVFTAIVTEGLRTGDADLDHDGLISVHDLYSYIRERAVEITPRQSPEMTFSGGGEFFVAINPRLTQAQLITSPSREASDTETPSAPMPDGQTRDSEPCDEPEDELIYWSRVVDAMRESAERIELASALSRKGAILVRLHFYDEAVSPYEESAAICRDLSDYAGEVAALISLVGVYDELGLTDDSAAASRRVAELRGR